MVDQPEVVTEARKYAEEKGGSFTKINFTVGEKSIFLSIFRSIRQSIFQSIYLPIYLSVFLQSLCEFVIP